MQTGRREISRRRREGPVRYTGLGAGLRKTHCPEACPGKAGVFSGRQTHRGKSQEPRSLDSEEEGNRISETYRQSHLKGW